eukprot:scaffold19557_cov76-Cyclotella_meneghiniana.AAC.2
MGTRCKSWMRWASRMGSSRRRKEATWRSTRGVASDCSSGRTSTLAYPPEVGICFSILWRNSPRPVFMSVWREAEVWGLRAWWLMRSRTWGESWAKLV